MTTWEHAALFGSSEIAHLNEEVRPEVEPDDAELDYRFLMRLRRTIYAPEPEGVQSEVVWEESDEASESDFPGLVKRLNATYADEVGRAIALLGAQGWELVNVLYIPGDIESGSTGQWTAYFKRPVASE